MLKIQLTMIVTALIFYFSVGTGTVLAEEKIYLKDGSVISGKVIESTEDYITIETQFGELKIEKSKVQRIEFGNLETVKKPLQQEVPKIVPKEKTTLFSPNDLATIQSKCAFELIYGGISTACFTYNALTWKASSNEMKTGFEGTPEEMRVAARDACSKQNATTWIDLGWLGFTIWWLSSDGKTQGEAFDRFLETQTPSFKLANRLGVAVGLVASTVALLYDLGAYREYEAGKGHLLDYEVAERHYVKAANRWRNASTWSWVAVGGWGSFTLSRIAMLYNTGSITVNSQSVGPKSGIFVKTGFYNASPYLGIVLQKAF